MPPGCVPASSIDLAIQYKNSPEFTITIIELTMTTITSTIRYHAWNIVIRDYPPACRCLAGAFQSIDEPFLTWKDLFHDLLLCFHLEPYIAAPDAQLALYLLNANDALVDKPGTPFVYYSGPEEQLSKYIKLKPERLIVCLICHNVADCKDAKAELEHHLQSGMLGCHQ